MNNAARQTFPCQRCNGAGRIAHHSNVLSGVCFKCGGSGAQKSKPSSPQPRWQVSADEKTTGKHIVVFYLRAKSETAALAQAKMQLSGSVGYLPETAKVKKS